MSEFVSISITSRSNSTVVRIDYKLMMMSQKLIIISGHADLYPIFDPTLDRFEIHGLFHNVVVSRSIDFLDWVHKHCTVLVISNLSPHQADILLPRFLLLLLILELPFSRRGCGGCGCRGIALTACHALPICNALTISGCFR